MDGKETLHTPASKTLQNEALEMPGVSEGIQGSAQLVRAEPYTEEDRWLNKTMVEEACAHHVGRYIKEILLEGGEYDSQSFRY